MVKRVFLCKTQKIITIPLKKPYKSNTTATKAKNPRHFVSTTKNFIYKQIIPALLKARREPPFSMYPDYRCQESLSAVLQ